jgi:Ca2+/Na+ antiporter
LIIANSLFVIITLITFFIQQKALKNSNPNVFFRSVMAGMMIKMFVCIIAIIIYWLVMQDKFSRATVFAAMLIYLIYLVIEVRLVTKLNRQKNA